MNSKIEYNSDYIERSQEILDNFNSESGVKFDYKTKEGFRIFPLSINNITDEEVIAELYQSKNKNLINYFERSDQEKKGKIIRDYRNILSSGSLGGLSITGRTLDEMVQFVPNLKKRILEKGRNNKIVILGNGLSLAAEEILNLFSEKDKPEIVLVDVIDYGQLVIDLFELKQLFLKHKLPFPEEYERDFQNAKKLISLIRSRKVKAVKYVVGSSHPPESIKDADIVVNIWGPSSESMDEQLSLLKPDGIMLTNY